MFCFRFNSKRTKPKRFAFVPIISFVIETFVLSFRYRLHYYIYNYSNCSLFCKIKLTKAVFLSEGRSRNSAGIISQPQLVLRKMYGTRSSKAGM
jgi:hypothetical protein